MAKYKLKKWYPSLPKDWKVGDTITKSFSWYIHDRIGISSKIIHTEEVENNPEFWELVKGPILTTEDGVEIFKGDIYWRLIAVLKNQRVFIYIEKVDEKGEFPYRCGGGGLFFSTKERAEQYFEENKPLYSKKDILNLYEKLKTHTFSYWGILLDELIIRREKQ